MEFLKHNILITGASSGIGLAVAKGLSEQGAESLIITARDQAKLAQSAGQLGDIRVCDHAEKSQIDVLCDGLEKDNLLPTVLVANVGVNPFHQLGPKKVQNTDYELLEKTLRVNTLNTFHLISRLVVAMKGHKFGRIVLVGSQAYLHGVPGQVSYNISKAALVGLKNTLVSEYGRAGVFCHLVNPGVVENERTEKLRKRAGKDFKTVTETQVAQAIIDALAIDVSEQNGQEINI